MSFEQNVTEWYRNYLGRAPEKGGWDNYMGQLQGGRNPYEIAHEIQYSKEGREYAAKQAAAAEARTRGAIADVKYHADQRVQRANNELLALQNKIGGYEDRIRGFQRDIDDYRFRNNELQGQYTNALGQVQDWTTKANEFQKQSADWEDQFNQRTVDWETARDEAQRYRNEAVGRQLQGLRGGATTGGSNNTQGGGGTLASGKTGYRAFDDKAIEIEKNIKAESGALSGKGPVVQRIAARRPSSDQAQRQSQGQGGSGSYYASRFR